MVVCKISGILDKDRNIEKGDRPRRKENNLSLEVLSPSRMVGVLRGMF